MRKSDSKVYALKRVKINKMSKKEISDGTQRYFKFGHYICHVNCNKNYCMTALNEIRFLASIRHKNIVGFLESFLGKCVCKLIIRHLR